MNRADLADELFILVERKGLSPIGKRLIRLVVNFYDQPGSTNGDAGTGQGCNHEVLSRSMGRIDDHREVRQTAHRRDGSKIQSVARVLGEGTNATLAENDLIVALGHDVFCG